MKATYTNTWLEMQINSYRWYRNNGYFDIARHVKQNILGVTKMSEEDFIKKVNA